MYAYYAEITAPIVHDGVLQLGCCVERAGLTCKVVVDARHIITIGSDQDHTRMNAPLQVIDNSCVSRSWLGLATLIDHALESISLSYAQQFAKSS